MNNVVINSLVFTMLACSLLVSMYAADVLVRRHTKMYWWGVLARFLIITTIFTITAIAVVLILIK